MPTQSSKQIFLRRRVVAFALLSAVLGLLAALFSLYRVGLVPPTLEARQLQEGGATVRAAVQMPPDYRPLTVIAFETQAKRGTLIANVIASPPVLARIAAAIDVEPSEITASADINANVPIALTEPANERRASQIRTSHAPYELDLQAQPLTPILDVYAKAPTPARAAELADATIAATNSYLRDLARQEGVSGPATVTLRQLGPARGGALEPIAPAEIAALSFLVVFAICFGLLFLCAQARAGWLRAAARPGGIASLLPAAPVPSRPAPRRRGDWPFTNRILPWMVAAFLAMLWLLPINAITVQASLPVDLKLDRVVLPLIVVTWLLSLAAGGREAPRWRFTAVHAGVAIFVAVAFLSVVLNAAYLNQTLELGVAIKKLTLLAAFFSVFLLVASVVRPTEVRPFLTFMLGLSVLCALGMLWEYRFETNLFYSWAGKLLPGFFQIAAVGTGYDEVGRREVVGSADLSLEAVAMLSMALPIALVRLADARRLGLRLLYALAICLLLGAMLATYRKSALLAPVAIVLVFAYFRRRDLVRLAPLGVVILLSIPILAPNALGSIIDQFEPSRLGVATVSDRVSDYDAIRPDVLSHLAFGRGFGSYEHTSYRILDNDILLRVVETGLIGLASFLLMIGLVLATAAPIVRGRHPDWAPTALAVAAAAVAFLVLSFLFDLTSFPHVPYIFLILAGFLAVVARQVEEDAAPPPRPRVTAAPPLPDPGPARPVHHLPTPV